jgi:hypothetical protein
MLTVRYQNICIVLLMLIFSMQVIASSSDSCHNQNAPTQSSGHIITSVMGDHSQHVGLKSPTDINVLVDYCPDCDCNLDGCVSSATLPITENVFSTTVISLTSSHIEQVHTYSSTSIFRPPISR